MAMQRQDTPPDSFIRSGAAPQPSEKSWKKVRSNSLSTNLDPDPESAGDETMASAPSDKLDVREIRKKFENLYPAEKPPSNGFPKRTSIPTPHPPPFQTKAFCLTPPPSSLSKKTLPTETPVAETSVFKFDPSQKSKSASPQPPARDGVSKSLIQKTLGISMKSLLNNETRSSSMEELDNAPVPESNDSSQMAENNEKKQRESVRKMRAIFEDPTSAHFYKSTIAKPDVPPVGKSPSPAVMSNRQQPPPRPAPRPERYLKLQVNSWHSMPSFDPADSATGDSSVSSNQNLSRRTSSDCSFSDEEEEYAAQRAMKLRKCLEEVHATEKTYVNVLYVLSVKLSAEVKNTCDKDDNAILTFNSTYKPLLGAIQQIYELHHKRILPEMEDHITGHRTGHMWLVLKENSKLIEVLYKEYYVKCSDTQGKLDELCRSSPLINEAMLKCQAHLGNLFPLTQLNCPNQRLLRYILCLKTYLKYLDENSEEYKCTRAIHDELDRIAVCCDEELVVSSAQVLELKERLDNKFECIKDYRKLLWHGSLKKQSPRRHADIAPRYMILFSDCILVCSEESGRKLDINRELSMRGITIDVIQGGRSSLMPNLDQQTAGVTYYPFRVNAVEKSYEFLVDKESDRATWVKKIRQASNDFIKRNSNIEVRQTGRRSDGQQQLGFRAPAWVNDSDVTRCQNCNNRFPPTLLSSRRHHCRSCGRCICGSCSTKKLLLEYCKSEGEVRICDTCYTHFTGTVLSKNTSIWPKPTREADETILFGDFRPVNSGGLIWVALQEDYQLHVYGARLDQAEDYAIRLPNLLDLQLDKETRTFTLRETTKTHTFGLEASHQIIYQKSGTLDEKLKNSAGKLSFHAELWFEAIQLARSTTLPTWYIRKRDSSDSGVSNVS